MFQYSFILHLGFRCSTPGPKLWKSHGYTIMLNLFFVVGGCIKLYRESTVSGIVYWHSYQFFFFSADVDFVDVLSETVGAAGQNEVYSLTRDRIPDFHRW